VHRSVLAVGGLLGLRDYTVMEAERR